MHALTEDKSTSAVGRNIIDPVGDESSMPPVYWHVVWSRNLTFTSGNEMIVEPQFPISDEN